MKGTGCMFLLILLGLLIGEHTQGWPVVHRNFSLYWSTSDSTEKQVVRRFHNPNIQPMADCLEEAEIKSAFGRSYNKHAQTHNAGEKLSGIQDKHKGPGQ